MKRVYYMYACDTIFTNAQLYDEYQAEGEKICNRLKANKILAVIDCRDDQESVVVTVPDEDYEDALDILKTAAICSSTILPNDGTYRVRRFAAVRTPDFFACVPHYIGHPATKNIIENMGAIPSESKLFTGLEIGQRMITCSIKQGRSNRTGGGTAINQEVCFDDLDFRVVERIE